MVVNNHNVQVSKKKNEDTLMGHDVASGHEDVSSLKHLLSNFIHNTEREIHTVLNGFE